MMSKPFRRVPNGVSVTTAMDSLKSAVVPKLRGARAFTRVASLVSSTRYMIFSFISSNVCIVLAKVVPGGLVAVTKKEPRSSRGVNSSGIVLSSHQHIAVRPSTMGMAVAGKFNAKPSTWRYSRCTNSNTRFSSRAMKPSPSRSRMILEASIGVSVSATKPLKPTAIASVTLNSANMRPVSPGMKVTGTNTASSTSVVAMTAKPTCRVPRNDATSGFSPSSMRR